MKIMKMEDRSFFNSNADALKIFGMKSFFSLFTNLTVNPSFDNQCQKFEMAYCVLDILFLLGNPRQSVTSHDDYLSDGSFMTGQNLPKNFSDFTQIPENEKEHKVRIDRTSQILCSINLAIAE